MTVTAAQAKLGLHLLFAPIFAALWAWLGARKRSQYAAEICAGAGAGRAWFLGSGLGCAFADDSFRVPLVFLVLAYLLHTTGELCLSPVGCR